MAYNTMKKLIRNANAKYVSGVMSAEEYAQYRESQGRKIDVFYATGKLTQEQYEELCGSWADAD